ncbi:MAG: serine hydrolase [Chitinophagaceae bacterium]
MKSVSFSFLVCLVLTGMLTACGSGRRVTDRPQTGELAAWMKTASPVFDSVLAHQADWRVQICYSRIHRDKKGNARFEDFRFGTDSVHYFYPASTVKLPVALLALQRLRELDHPRLNRETMMITEATAPPQTITYNDPTSAAGSPSIAQYIRKVFLVSDNDAFNRLYEFLGPDYINDNLRAHGLPSVNIVHRLSVAMSAEDNRQLNPIRFLDSGAHTILELPARNDKWISDAPVTKIGKGFYQNGQLINAPFDFSQKNSISLTDLHQLMKAIFFPGSLPASQRFDLQPDDLAFLKECMSAYPYEGLVPGYANGEKPDSVVKVFAAAAGNVLHAPQFRVFDKVGGAYGFLTNTAYVLDEKTGIEFLLSATIYCNSDGILNDDRYDYEQTGYPFMRALARLIYAEEKKRNKQ